MARLLSLFFIPQEGNNHKALLLQPSFLGLFIATYLLNQSIIKSLLMVKPGILGYSSEITATKVLDLTNSQRSQNGLPPLRYNPTLSASATLKAKDMFANDYWSHTSPSGRSPWDFFKEAGYQYSIAGENLAKDFYDTESMMKAWIKSPTHRANIVSDKYQEIGIGVVNGILGGVKTTLVVQHFAAPINNSGGITPVTNDKSPTVDLPLQSDVLSVSASPGLSISPMDISKAIGSLMFIIIIAVLTIDGYITVKNGIHRLSGSSTGHVAFLAIIFMLMLFTRQGTIF